jgi:hypothetical protein
VFRNEYGRATWHFQQGAFVHMLANEHMFARAHSRPRRPLDDSMLFVVVAWMLLVLGKKVRTAATAAVFVTCSVHMMPKDNGAHIKIQRLLVKRKEKASVSLYSALTNKKIWQL